MAAPLFAVIRAQTLRTVPSNTRNLSSRKFCSSHSTMKGLVLGVYHGEKEGEVQLTTASQAFQTSTAGKLLDLVNLSRLADKKGKQRVFYGLDTEFPSIAVVSLGKRGVGFNEAEEIEEGRENVRAGVAAGVKQLKDAGATTIHVDPCGDPEAAAEAAHLCVFVYDELKTDEKKKSKVDIQCYTAATDDAHSVQTSWDRGSTLAEGQNLAKRLMEAPANVMTPTRFTEIAEEKLSGLDKVVVHIRDQAWAESMKMGSFLSVSRGSLEPLRFLELQYNGGTDGAAPLALVGKGVTFDSGGISIKAAQGMEAMRADMGGAACALAAIYTAAKLRLPINVIGLMPLCENMPSGSATKPGDVVKAMNGKTIQVDNTDAEGRLILADALHYAESFKPRGIVDMATLTGGVIVALGSAATGVFTNSSTFWDTMHQAGMRTGDRVWRMPLFQHYSKQVGDSHLADVVNTCGSWGSSCTAAAFLKEFVTNSNWMHMDIAGVTSFSSCKSNIPYIPPHITGRPTRTVVEFLAALSKQPAN